MLTITYSLIQTEAYSLQTDSLLCRIETLRPDCAIRLDWFTRTEDDGYNDALALMPVRSIDIAYLEGFHKGTKEWFNKNKFELINKYRNYEESAA